jgi:hypothetical protein
MSDFCVVAVAVSVPILRCPMVGWTTNNKLENFGGSHLFRGIEENHEAYLAGAQNRIRSGILPSARSRTTIRPNGATVEHAINEGY